MVPEPTPDEQKRRFAELCERLLGLDDSYEIPAGPPLAIAEDLVEPLGQPVNDNSGDAGQGLDEASPI